MAAGRQGCKGFKRKVTMKYKLSQMIMVWFLPLIVIGGLFWPWLGYLVGGMFLFFLTLSYFKARYWCGNLCPRGSFLDIVLSRISFNRPIPTLFKNQWFRWLVFVTLMGFLTVRIISVWPSGFAIGGVFVGMCVLTTIVAVILGIATRHRAWCMICPMGNLQEQIGKIKKK